MNSGFDLDVVAFVALQSILIVYGPDLLVVVVHEHHLFAGIDAFLGAALGYFGAGPGQSKSSQPQSQQTGGQRTWTGQTNRR